MIQHSVEIPILSPLIDLTRKGDFLELTIDSQHCRIAQRPAHDWSHPAGNTDNSTSCCGDHSYIDLGVVTPLPATTSSSLTTHKSLVSATSTVETQSAIPTTAERTKSSVLSSGIPSVATAPGAAIVSAPLNMTARESPSTKSGKASPAILGLGIGLGLAICSCILGAAAFVIRRRYGKKSRGLVRIEKRMSGGLFAVPVAKAPVELDRTTWEMPTGSEAIEKG